MAFAPRTVQNMPDCLSLPIMVLQPASITPDPMRCQRETSLEFGAHLLTIPYYSALNVSIGSSLAARRAGTSAAKIVTIINAPATPASVSRSNAEILYSIVSTNRVAKNNPTAPSRIPQPINLNASFKIIRNTVPGVAPIATRTPISTAI